MDGNVKRLKQEQEAKEAVRKQKVDSAIKHWTKSAKEEVLGTYKRTVIDSYLNTFTENYGDNFDYNSLVNSLSFNITEDKNGDLSPSFKFNSNNVKFKPDMYRDFKNFNENMTPDFTKTNTVIDPDYIEATQFNSAAEYEAYNSGGNYSELIDIEGMFIPTSVGERYGTFNKINKLKGYATKVDSNKSADKKAQNIWSKLKDKVFSNTIKKFKIQ